MRTQFDFPPPEPRVHFNQREKNLNAALDEANMSILVEVLHSTPGKSNTKVKIQPSDKPPSEEESEFGSGEKEGENTKSE